MSILTLGSKREENFQSKEKRKQENSQSKNGRKKKKEKKKGKKVPDQKKKYAETSLDRTISEQYRIVTK